jgi:hypothetical protein
MEPNTDGWTKAEQHVIESLKRLEAKADRHEEVLTDVRGRLVAVEVRGGFIAAAMGAVTAFWTAHVKGS